MKNFSSNGNRGFLKLIIIVVVALVLMKFLGISFADIVNWFKELFK